MKRTMYLLLATVMFASLIVAGCGTTAPATQSIATQAAATETTPSVDAYAPAGYHLLDLKELSGFSFGGRDAETYIGTYVVGTISVRTWAEVNGSKEVVEFENVPTSAGSKLFVRYTQSESAGPVSIQPVTTQSAGTAQTGSAPSVQEYAPVGFHQLNMQELAGWTFDAMNADQYVNGFIAGTLYVKVWADGPNGAQALIEFQPMPTLAGQVIFVKYSAVSGTPPQEIK